MAQLVTCLPVDFGSGHDLLVHEVEPHVGFCAASTNPGWDSLSPPLSVSPLLVRLLSLSLSFFLSLSKK